ncbi:KOW-like protein, partial [Tanacetum coccineum]
NSNFGVIIRVDSEAIQVLKRVADRAEVQLVRLRDIKYKIDRKLSAQDRYKNTGNPLASRVAQLRTPSRFPNSPGRSPARGVPPLSGGRHRGGGRGGESLAGRSIKIRLGPWKGYKGRVVDANGTTVRIELESQMKVVTDNRTHISGIVNAPTTLISVYSDTIYAFFSAILYN